MILTSKKAAYVRNLAVAKRIWSSQINRELKHSLKSLSENYGLSIAAGDLKLMENGWYVTHSGLVRLAQRKRCSSITVDLVKSHSDWASARWVFKAIVYTRHRSHRFVGYGDADPSNVSSVVQGAEMRVAETRAVNRALRKAYGIGICSVEELGSFKESRSGSDRARPSSVPANHPGNGKPRLRDQLCVLIRQHNLNPKLVKAYAADFCGTATLSGASRDLVESFVSHLSTTAKENRDGLICKLNSYAESVEAQP